LFKLSHRRYVLSALLLSLLSLKTAVPVCAEGINSNVSNSAPSSTAPSYQELNCSSQVPEQPQFNLFHVLHDWFTAPFAFTLDRQDTYGHPNIIFLGQQHNPNLSSNPELSSDKESSDKTTAISNRYLVSAHFSIPPLKRTFLRWLTNAHYEFAREKLFISWVKDGKPTFTPLEYIDVNNRFWDIIPTNKNIDWFPNEPANTLNKFKLSSQSQDDLSAKTCLKCDLKILSVFPDQRFLHPSFDQTTTNDFLAEFDPKYQNGSAGKTSYEHKDQLEQKWADSRYAYVIGSGAGHQGRVVTATWTFYPFKYQPIIMGDQEIYLTLDIPTNVKKLAILPVFEYKLKMWIWPFKGTDRVPNSRYLKIKDNQRDTNIYIYNLPHTELAKGIPLNNVLKTQSREDNPSLDSEVRTETFTDTTEQKTPDPKTLVPSGIKTQPLKVGEPATSVPDGLVNTQDFKQESKIERQTTRYKKDMPEYKKRDIQALDQEIKDILDLNPVPPKEVDKGIKLQPLEINKPIPLPVKTN